METHVFHIRKLFFVVLTTTPYACHAFQHVSTDGSAIENGGPRTAAAKVRARQTFR